MRSPLFSHVYRRRTLVHPVGESRATSHPLTIWDARSDVPGLPGPSALGESRLWGRPWPPPVCRRTRGDRASAGALTEQVIPGHVCLLLRLQRLENEHLVMVEVPQQFLAVKRDPTAPLHQVPAGERGDPLTREPPLCKTRLRLPNPLKILSSHSPLVSVYFPFLEVLFLSFKKKRLYINHLTAFQSQNYIKHTLRLPAPPASYVALSVSCCFTVSAFLSATIRRHARVSALKDSVVHTARRAAPRFFAQQRARPLPAPRAAAPPRPSSECGPHCAHASARF